MISEVNAIKDLILNQLEFKQNGVYYMDISVIVKPHGEDHIHITELEQSIQITLYLPVEIQGNMNYHIIRMHDGVAEMLEATYDAQTNSLTFSTDKFCTYAIAYNVPGNPSNNLWWLLLLLLLPIGYIGFRYKDTISSKFSKLLRQLKNKK